VSNIYAVVEVTCYELAAEKLMEFINIPDGLKAVVLPLATPDGLPNHVQIIAFRDSLKIPS
jgi:hypothetical protein